jgi:group I intron endonuclease
VAAKYSNPADSPLKKQILKENKGKCGIYRWTNKENAKSYIGSSVDLARRFRDYSSKSFLSRPTSKMAIYKALLKYGYSKLSIEILQYCEPSEAISREQFFIDLLKPKYNILRTAGGEAHPLGFKHAPLKNPKL